MLLSVALNDTKNDDNTYNAHFISWGVLGLFCKLLFKEQFMQWSFIHPHIIPNLYDWLFFHATQKETLSRMCTLLFSMKSSSKKDKNHFCAIFQVLWIYMDYIYDAFLWAWHSQNSFTFIVKKSIAWAFLGIPSDSNGRKKVRFLSTWEWIKWQDFNF